MAEPLEGASASEPKRGLSRGCLIALVGTLVLGMLAVGAAVFGAYYWFENNQGELRELGLQAQAEGQAHGQGRQASACFDAALPKLDACASDLEILCQVRVRVFLQHCLHAAQVPEGVCDGVPETSAILDTVAWRNDACERLGRAGNERCARLMEAVQDYCHGAS